MPLSESCTSVPWVCSLLQAFFADIYVEALAAIPATGHWALAGMAAAGKLLRHYTLNIDGLHNAVGLSTWHHERDTAGVLQSPWNHCRL